MTFDASGLRRTVAGAASDAAQTPALATNEPRTIPHLQVRVPAGATRREIAAALARAIDREGNRAGKDGRR